MIQFKICLLGVPMVGKTSLVQRYVHGGFSENYHSTVGVKIDKKSLDIDGQDVRMLVWDVQGEERYTKILPTYLRGMAGYLLVVDVTRPETVEGAARLHEGISNAPNPPPYLLLLNKSDLVNELPSQLDAFKDAAAVLQTSALSGQNVEEAFNVLGELLLDLRLKQRKN